MKALLFFRRSALLAFLFAVSLTACKKSEMAPAPDLASRVSGQYTYSELTSGGKTYPANQTNLAGGIKITRQTATTVSMAVTFTLKTGETYAEDSVDNVTVTETSSSTVEFRSGSYVIARATGNKISIDGDGPDGEAVTISATK